MSTSLFDTLDRTDTGPAKHSESSFDYLNRTARSSFAHVRKILESWFDVYPVDGQKELRSRFRSGRQESHLGAFFELYCHTLLAAQGYAMKLHPDVGEGMTTRPDFLVIRDGEPFMYFEATLVLPSASQQATVARQAQIEDAIDQLNLQDFFVGMVIQTEGASSPSTNAIGSFVRASVATLDADDLLECQHARFSYVADGWSIEFRFIPKKQEARSKSGTRSLGITSTPHGPMDPQTAIKTKLKGKASKYGKLSLPYVIAIDCLHDFLEVIDVDAALFGDEEFIIRSDGGATTSRRRQNGFWWGRNGRTNRRVSAVLCVDHLVPWTVGSSNPELWHNPFAEKPIAAQAWRGPQWIPDSEESRLKFENGTDVPELINTKALSLALKQEH